MKLQLSFHSIRIVIGYAQVISQLSSVLHVELPQTFVAVIRPLLILAVDASALLRGCLPCLTVYEQWSIYVIAVPLAMAMLVLGLYAVDRCRAKAAATDRMKERANFVLFLLYPSVCRRSFSVFNCRHLGEQGKLNRCR